MMTSKTILFFIVCALISQVGQAQEVTRATKSVRFTTAVDLSNDEAIVQALKAEGIFIDDHSTISIHEEKNTIDLTCFSCVIRNIGDQIDMVQPFNEATAK